MILHFADHDPSGLDMTRDLRRRFEEYANAAGFDGEIEVERVALTIEQVKKWDLPPNPTKRADARTPAYMAEYGDACLELDAVPPDELRQLIREAIVQHMNVEAWNERLDRIEREKHAIGHAIESSKPELERVKTVVINRARSELGTVEHV